VAYEAYDARATVVIHAGDTIYNIGHAKYELQTSVSSFAEIEDDIYGLSLLLGSLQEARQTAGEINATWDESLVAYQNTRMVDIVPAGCSKGNAVRMVRELLDVDVVAGIGDSFNDIPLLEAADVAYAFSDAPDELRLVATKTVRSAGAALEDFTRRRDG
jgi:HAD superfamily hydrolase (TIGR01484 family)